MERAVKILLFLGIFLGVICVFGCDTYAFAFLMESGNYKLDVDDSSSSGGDWTSTNYVFRDTMGEVSTGRSDSASYKLRAGYQEMLESYISISVPDDLALSPDIPGITGGTASGTITWTVISDNSAGFGMQIKAGSYTAMKLPSDPTYYFDDYSPNNLDGLPDIDWSVDAGDAEFGYTVEPETLDDTVALFKEFIAPRQCGGGTANLSDTCWFNLTTDYQQIINRSSRTDTDGEDENIKFKAQSAGKFLKEGEYQATVTVVAASN